MNINELEAYKCYKAKDMFYTYIFRFKKYETHYDNYVIIYYERLYRKVGVETFYSSNHSIYIKADTQFELISYNIADKVFKIMEMAISAANTLI